MHSYMHASLLFFVVLIFKKSDTFIFLKKIKLSTRPYSAISVLFVQQDYIQNLKIIAEDCLFCLL